MPLFVDEYRNDHNLDQIGACQKIKTCIHKIIKRKKLSNDHGLDRGDGKTGHYFVFGNCWDQ